ncbi:uncharacterized protein LOC133183033 [Saccostrea echinata]|uniref:uncharacterized protein LOC133183033 n=1 Tax=Saccostrea echinata TaxID=191078 RepID=UPI002A84146F|nr:uncharacterized protein LOC133183033 [Saccostrea echinata]
MERFLAVALLVVLCFASGRAINCITCDSLKDVQCGDPFTADQEKYIVKCKPTETYCGKIVSTEDSRSAPFVKRSCVEDRSNENYTWTPPAECEELNLLTTCYCKTSRCNSSDRSAICLLLLAFSVVFAFMIRKNY